MWPLDGTLATLISRLLGLTPTAVDSDRESIAQILAIPVHDLVEEHLSAYLSREEETRKAPVDAVRWARKIIHRNITLRDTKTYIHANETNLAISDDGTVGLRQSNRKLTLCYLENVVMCDIDLIAPGLVWEEHPYMRLAVTKIIRGYLERVAIQYTEVIRPESCTLISTPHGLHAYYEYASPDAAQDWKSVALFLRMTCDSAYVARWMVDRSRGFCDKVLDFGKAPDEEDHEDSDQEDPEDSEGQVFEADNALDHTKVAAEAVPIFGSSGLKWEEIHSADGSKPENLPSGNVAKLREQLESDVRDFSQEQLNAWEIRGLTTAHVVNAGGRQFKPVGYHSKPIEQALEVRKQVAGRLNEMLSWERDDITRSEQRTLSFKSLCFCMHRALASATVMDYPADESGLEKTIKAVEEINGLDVSVIGNVHTLLFQYVPFSSFAVLPTLEEGVRDFFTHLLLPSPAKPAPLTTYYRDNAEGRPRIGARTKRCSGRACARHSSPSPPRLNIDYGFGNNLYHALNAAVAANRRKAKALAEQFTVFVKKSARSSRYQKVSGFYNYNYGHPPDGMLAKVLQGETTIRELFIDAYTGAYLDPARTGATKMDDFKRIRPEFLRGDDWIDFRVFCKALGRESSIRSKYELDWLTLRPDDFLRRIGDVATLKPNLSKVLDEVRWFAEGLPQTWLLDARPYFVSNALISKTVGDIFGNPAFLQFSVLVKLFVARCRFLVDYAEKKSGENLLHTIVIACLTRSDIQLKTLYVLKRWRRHVTREFIMEAKAHLSPSSLSNIHRVEWMSPYIPLADMAPAIDTGVLMGRKELRVTMSVQNTCQIAETAAFWEWPAFGEWAEIARSAPTLLEAFSDVQGSLRNHGHWFPGMCCALNENTNAYNVHVTTEPFSSSDTYTIPKSYCAPLSYHDTPLRQQIGLSFGFDLFEVSEGRLGATGTLQKESDTWRFILGEQSLVIVDEDVPLTEGESAKIVAIQREGEWGEEDFHGRFFLSLEGNREVIAKNPMSGQEVSATKLHDLLSNGSVALPETETEVWKRALRQSVKKVREDHPAWFQDPTRLITDYDYPQEESVLVLDRAGIFTAIKSDHAFLENALMADFLKLWDEAVGAEGGDVGDFCAVCVQLADKTPSHAFSLTNIIARFKHHADGSKTSFLYIFLQFLAAWVAGLITYHDLHSSGTAVSSGDVGPAVRSDLVNYLGSNDIASISVADIVRHLIETRPSLAYHAQSLAKAFETLWVQFPFDSVDHYDDAIFHFEGWGRDAFRFEGPPSSRLRVSTHLAHACLLFLTHVTDDALRWYGDMRVLDEEGHYYPYLDAVWCRELEAPQRKYLVDSANEYLTGEPPPNSGEGPPELFNCEHDIRAVFFNRTKFRWEARAYNLRASAREEGVGYGVGFMSRPPRR